MIQAHCLDLNADLHRPGVYHGHIDVLKDLWSAVSLDPPSFHAKALFDLGSSCQLTLESQGGSTADLCSGDSVLFKELNSFTAFSEEILNAQLQNWRMAR
jgi:hypothetical protein